MFNGCRGLRGNFYPARYPDDYVRLSYADALVLNTSRYFNHAANYIDNTAPDVTATTPAAQTPANGLARITFTTTDNAALAGALLHFDGSQEVVGEMLLSGTATNATFLTPYFHPGQTNVFGIAVYDTSGNRRYTNFSIFISSTTNQAPQPSVRVFPPSALVGEDVILDASRTTDPDNTSGFRVQWDLDGDGVFDTPLSTTLLFTNRFATAGLHLIRARVVDAGGAATISTPIDLRAYVPILSGSPITNHFLVSWPVWMAGFHLESNATLNSPLNWQTVGGDPVISGMSNLVDVPMVNNPQGFLRLERP